MAEAQGGETIYDFTAYDIDGNEVHMSQYKSQVCLIVNVASKWGFADKNYKQLQAMHNQLAEAKGLRILAFPCNQFANQEPKSNAEIKDFVQKKYGVEFDLFGKIDVNGKNAHPLWNFLKSKQKGKMGSFIKWNYTKFLVDKEGKPVARYAPTVEPNAIVKDLDKYF